MEGAVDQASLRQRAYVNEAGSGFRGRKLLQKASSFRL